MCWYLASTPLLFALATATTDIISVVVWLISKFYRIARFKERMYVVV